MDHAMLDIVQRQGHALDGQVAHRPGVALGAVEPLDVELFLPPGIAPAERAAIRPRTPAFDMWV